MFTSAPASMKRVVSSSAPLLTASIRDVCLSCRQISSTCNCTVHILCKQISLRSDKISLQSRLPYPRLLYVFHVCLFVCASALITSAVITSHTLLPCDFTCSTWQLLWVLADVATMSSLAELQLWDTKEQRQCRHTADQKWKHETWAATHDATKQLTD